MMTIDDDLTLARRLAIEEDRCFSKGRLRDEFRMKPKPDAIPVKYYKNEFGMMYPVFRIADCVPMRPKKEPTEKQVMAGELLGLKTQLKTRKAIAGHDALGWLEASPLVLDTETTGLDGDDQIVEIAILDSSGSVLIDTRLKPSVPVGVGARNVHGIDDDALKDAPAWPDVSSTIREILEDREVIIFNSDFDMRLIRQTADAFGDDHSWLRSVTDRCAMRLSAKAYGATNRYGTISLSNAAWEAGITWSGDAHSARADATATLDVVKAIAGYTQGLEQKIGELESAKH